MTSASILGKRKKKIKLKNKKTQFLIHDFHKSKKQTLFVKGAAYSREYKTM